ncbi:TPA: protoheme IX farnesyltransferase [Candidatus Campbellbacteria bacterium]|uniref:Protoheme IX farnesyltransferase n=1 Tax=Candidatus Nomurabacteria bacterium GW2011_GWC2_42_20 TaxID=1618756 RepID=A0A0G1BQ35_9BACT|nr:MAG: Protoheme IX farnesyltransferase [Parcubacteria group bacterium GW2011_GWC1_42_11]KKS48346.1 MAG: Protoheme IX farnesyltransferase [Candidatus Nomurabacteria bacterium GW2011_GWC2_42_20]KKS59014.1 MAG: Protoheme IX farnesyltransferase [Candidatus Nomurabacteria bacterium GW2011_GWA2_42_41]KKT09922.1 MAG: Protoheme IX farnesyltransferase [Candidatus Nomurabacteria bacterium GW2011_GWB1_43_20]TAN35580.1 MAG: protoheme IX farnesyltransferase [Patescibacteria group bacterium]HBC70761.1 pro
MIKDYYFITKPGIIGGNAITAIAGFLLASRGDINWLILFATLAGLSLVVASGCVFNNYIDRDIDAIMERTKNRTMAQGRSSLRSALVYASVLGLTGLGILYFYTNFLAMAAALIGLFVYVVGYSLWLKRTSTISAIIGSVSGAMPPVVGYLAVTGNIDLGAVIIFFILAFWQMPHSYAIAIYRLRDYTNASIPVLPAEKGIYMTKVHMLIYVALFVMASLALSVFGYAGQLYFCAMILFGFAWFLLCVKGFFIKTTNNKKWAHSMYIFSIIIIAMFFLVVLVEALQI